MKTEEQRLDEWFDDHCPAAIGDRWGLSSLVFPGLYFARRQMERGGYYRGYMDFAELEIGPDVRWGLLPELVCH